MKDVVKYVGLRLRNSQVKFLFKFLICENNNYNYNNIYNYNFSYHLSLQKYIFL